MKYTFPTSHAAFSLSACALALFMLTGCAGHSGLVFPWTHAEDTRLEHVTVANFDERVLKCDKPVLVDFYAEWCNPCKQLTPVVEEFAAEHPEVRVVKVNVDDNHELTQRYGVKAMPTLLVIRGGQVVSRNVGPVPKKQIEEMTGSGAAAGNLDSTTSRTPGTATTGQLGP